MSSTSGQWHIVTHLLPMGVVGKSNHRKCTVSKMSIVRSFKLISSVKFTRISTSCFLAPFADIPLNSGPCCCFVLFLLLGLSCQPTDAKEPLHIKYPISFANIKDLRTGSNLTSCQSHPKTKGKERELREDLSTNSNIKNFSSQSLLLY